MRVNLSQPRRRLYGALGALALVVALIVLWLIFHPRAKPPPAPTSVPVTTAVVTAQDVPLTFTAIGAAQAWFSDTILAQVSGKLIRVNFAEGTDVRAGQVLAEVDPQPYRAALTAAEGSLTRDSAALAGARRDLLRYQHLVADNAISRQIEEDQAALVAQDEGIVKFDTAQVALAKINLVYCRIVSPIDGRAGVRLVDPGNIVSASGSVASTPNSSAATSTAPSSGTAVGVAGTSGASSGASGAGATSGGSGSTTATIPTTTGSGIVVINQIHPIAVTFTVPEGDFQRLVDASDTFRKPLAVQAFSQETGALLDSGQVSIADNRVDPSTGTIELKAQMPNPAGRLWPGQFVNVKLVYRILPKAISIPIGAVNRGPQGQFAFVVGPNLHVVARPVVVGWTQDQTAVISSGVNPGERVVIDGQMSLKNGSLVRIAQPAPPGRANP